MEEVTEHLGRPITGQEVLALNVMVDASVRRGVVVFVNFQTRQLQSAAEAQSKYLSFLSHDLRGGLNGILLMIEVLKRELSTEARFSGSIEDLDMMRRSILETVATMDRFLHAERFRKGKVQAKLSREDLRAMITEIAAHSSYQAKDKGITLETEVDHCVVTTDRELLTLILQNLISNAIKYSRHGTVKVSAHAINDPQSELACEIAVADQGPGIAPDRLASLFQPFTRGETHGESGVGLGLSIARQAADLLGAKLRAESTVGVGSIFYIGLPRKSPTLE
jgi:signal transduction histidine kinase